MKTILTFLEKYLLFIPRVGSILIDDLLFTVEQKSLRQKTVLEQRKIIETIRTLDTTKNEATQALNKAVEGNNAEVIRILVQYIQKYSK